MSNVTNPPRPLCKGESHPSVPSLANRGMKNRKQDHLALVIATATRKREIKAGDIVVETGLTRKQVLRVMDKLTRLGYLIKIREKLVKKSWDTHGGRRLRQPTWRLNTEKILDVGKVVKRKPNTLRDKIWRAIRIKRSFTPTALAAFAGLSYDTVCQYLSILEQNKVIHRKPNTGKFKEYLLLTDPGPERPLLKEKTTW